MAPGLKARSSQAKTSRTFRSRSPNLCGAKAVYRDIYVEQSALITKPAALNELTRSLTSTLELNPLLNRIMEGAVDILDCEAGSLLLMDEMSGESVFEVAIGPVGEDLIGKRLLSVKETARMLGISPRTIYNQIGKNSKKRFPIKPKRVGKLVKFDIHDIENYIRSI